MNPCADDVKHSFEVALCQNLMSASSMLQPSLNTTARPHSRLRALVHAAVVVIAAVGSIATSPARWHVAAAPVAKASIGKGQLVTIEASAEPTVTIGNGAIGRRARPEGPAGAWTGRADYFIPASEMLTSAEIMGTCSGGFCSKCEPPPGAFARAVSIVEVVPWVIEASSTPANIELTTANSTVSFRVVVAATRPPAFAVKLAAPIAAGFYASEMPGNPYIDPKDDPQAATKRYAFSVAWSKDSQGAAGPISGVWTPIVTISGYCKDSGPCIAPASERVTIVSVEGPPGSGAAPIGSAGP
jgi:hypothetical protein